MVNVLLKNGYPGWLLRRFLRTPEGVGRTRDEQPRVTISLPYVHGVTKALKRILKPYRIRTVMKPYQNLRQKLVHPKDVAPEMERPNVV